jgi:hypothetical protein
MPPRRLDAEIDHLYQLPPEAFTAARNTLAKGAGPDAAAVKRLAKPPIAAWAVNQLYWQQRDVYDALIRASTGLRQTHKAVLEGRNADLRVAGKTHEAAVEAALKAALSLLEANGHAPTDATRQALATTLRALPADEEPGRLSRTLQPGGFEMLAGLSIAPGSKSRALEGRSAAKPEAGGGGTPTARKAPAEPAPFHRKTPHAVVRPDPKAAARAREEAAKAEREVREAEHTARREEFEAARAARDAEKAERQLDHARQALAAAQEEVESAEAAATEAERNRKAADERAHEAHRVLDEARRRARK